MGGIEKNTTEAYIPTIEDFKRDMELAGQRPNTYKDRIKRLSDFRDKFGKEPIPEIYRMYYTDRLSVPQINQKLGIYKSGSGLYKLFNTLGWEKRDIDDDCTLEGREPLRQKSFDETIQRKTTERIRTFSEEVHKILHTSYDVSREFSEVEYQKIKTNIQKFLYLLETCIGLSKQAIVLVCSNTEVESSYYTEALNRMVAQECEKRGIEKIPKVSDDSLRAWIKSQNNKLNNNPTSP